MAHKKKKLEDNYLAEVEKISKSLKKKYSALQEDVENLIKKMRVMAKVAELKKNLAKRVNKK